jgi:hypothetical protein
MAPQVSQPPDPARRVRGYYDRASSRTVRLCEACAAQQGRLPQSGFVIPFAPCVLCGYQYPQTPATERSLPDGAEMLRDGGPLITPEAP